MARPKVASRSEVARGLRTNGCADAAGFFWGTKKSRNDCRDSSGNGRGPLSPARGTRAKKGPAASYSRTGGSRTTLGDGALDFSVRNGNWYFCPSMATGMKAVSLETKEKYNVKRERQEPHS